MSEEYAVGRIPLASIKQDNNESTGLLKEYWIKNGIVNQPRCDGEMPSQQLTVAVIHVFHNYPFDLAIESSSVA